jgi:hypothetical protein
MKHRTSYTIRLRDELAERVEACRASGTLGLRASANSTIETLVERGLDAAERNADTSNAAPERAA